MYKIFYTHTAIEDIKAIFRYISEKLLEPAIAAKQIGRIKKGIGSLADFPLRNKQTEWEPWHSLGMRQMPVDNHEIFYITDETKCEVQVVRIFYGARNIEELLKI